jgi:hypothetical protein
VRPRATSERRSRGHGSDAEHEAPATVLNSIMDVTRVAGKLGIPGPYLTGDPGAHVGVRRGTVPDVLLHMRSRFPQPQPSHPQVSGV